MLTNLPERLTALRIQRHYLGRAGSESVINELKHGLGLTGLCCQEFFATEAALALRVFTYHLTALFARHLGWLKRVSSGTLRYRLFSPTWRIRGRFDFFPVRVFDNQRGVRRKAAKGAVVQTPALFPRGGKYPSCAAIMFLRGSKRFKDGKPHHYWSSVENRRVVGGKAVPAMCSAWVKSMTLTRSRSATR